MRSDLGSGAGAMARGAGVNLLGMGATTVVGFVFAFAVTHVISAHDFGLYSLATSVLALAFLPGLLGLDTGVIRFVALGAGAKDERRARGALQLATVLVVFTSGAVTVLLWKYASWIAGSVFDKPDATDVLKIVALSLPGIAVGRVIVSSIRGFGVMTSAAWLGTIQRIFDLTAALPVLALGLGVNALAWASVVSAYASIPVAIALLLRVDPRALRPAADMWPLRRMVTFSVPQTFTVIFFLGVARLDILMLGRFGTASEVGIYAIALAVVLPATLVSTSIGQMFSPRTMSCRRTGRTAPGQARVGPAARQGSSTHRARSPDTSRIMGCDVRSRRVYTGVPSAPCGTGRKARDRRPACRPGLPEMHAGAVAARAAGHPRHISAVLPMSTPRPPKVSSRSAAASP